GVFVSERLVCSACRRPFELAPDNRQPWVECSHCKARNVNPETLEKLSPRQGWAVLGMLLIIFAALGGPWGACIVSFARFGQREDHSSEAIATLVGFLLLVAVGILLMVIGARPAEQPVGPGTTIFGATVLAFVVGLSAIIYGFSVCF